MMHSALQGCFKDTPLPCGHHRDLQIECGDETSNRAEHRAYDFACCRAVLRRLSAREVRPAYEKFAMAATMLKKQKNRKNLPLLADNEWFGLSVPLTNKVRALSHVDLIHLPSFVTAAFHDV